MNLILTSMHQCVRRGLVAVGLLAAVAGGSAHAGNVGISVGIQVPGVPVYVMPPPPPRVHYYHPAPPPVAYYPPPAPYGYWAPPPPPRGHGKHFKHRGHKHKHKHKHDHHRDHRR